MCRNKVNAKLGPPDIQTPDATIVSQPEHIILWKWFEQAKNFYGYKGKQLKALKQGYYCGFINLKNLRYRKQKLQKGWVCPNCGVIEGINVTFSEHCNICGEKVG